MSDYAEARRIVSDWESLSRIRGWAHVWSTRDEDGSPLVVRTAAGQLIREYTALIAHLAEEKQAVVDQLTAYDRQQSARLDGVYREVTGS